MTTKFVASHITFFTECLLYEWLDAKKFFLQYQADVFASRAQTIDYIYAVSYISDMYLNSILGMSCTCMCTYGKRAISGSGKNIPLSYLYA